MCDEGLLDDEMHFALYCERTKDLRTNFLSEVHAKTDIDIYGEKYNLLKQLLSKGCLKMTARHLEKL